MQTIIGVDGSELGWEAVRQAVTLLSPTKDHIALYYAPPKLSVRGSKNSVEAIAQARASLAGAVFDEALDRPRLASAWRSGGHDGGMESTTLRR